MMESDHSIIIGPDDRAELDQRIKDLAKSPGVTKHLLTGTRALHSAHPQILVALLAWSNQRQAAGLATNFGNYRGVPRSRKATATSKWQLAPRLSAKEFVRLYFSASKAVTPVLCALPDRMLTMAATKNGDLSEAFVCRGRLHYRAKPSEFFPGIDPSLDSRIIEHRLEMEVDFLTELAACTRGDDQDGFLKRWVTSPAEARAWVQTPKWQRQLLHTCTCRCFPVHPATKTLRDGRVVSSCECSNEAHQIWEAFKHLRGQLLGTSPTPGVPQRRATEHPQAVGTFFQHFAGFAFSDRPRWRDVFWMFGFMLTHGKDVGDMYTPPWRKR